MLDTALHLLQSRQKYFSLPQPFYNSAKVFEIGSGRNFLYSLALRRNVV